MSIRVKLCLEDSSSGKLIRKGIASGQKAIIGSTHEADIRVYNLTGVSTQHCEIAVSNDICTLRDLTGGRGTVLVNDKTATQNELSDGDVVTVGSNRITLEISGQDAGSATSVATFENTGTARTDDEPESSVSAIRQMANGLKVFEIPDREDVGTFLSEQVAGNRPYIMAINFRAIGENPGDHDAEDVLVDPSKELQQSNSISLLGPDQFNSFGDLPGKFYDKDCMIFLGLADTTMERNKFVEEATTLVNWWLQPSQFDFHMREGIALLLDRMFSLIDRAIYFLPSAGKWICITNNPEVSSIEQLVDQKLQV